MDKKNSDQLLEKLRESEERFKAAFDSVKDCILIWDKDYNYLYANPAAIEHVGTTADKVIGKNIRDGLGHIPDFMHLWMSRIDQVFETSKVLNFQDKTMMKESLMYSESVLTPILKSDGSVSAVCVVYRDITERKLDEEILKRQRDFSESIINTSNAIIVGLDKDHKIQLFNEGAEKITGYRKEEMIDKDWFHVFFPSEIVDDMISVWDDAWGIKFHTYINPILIKNGDSRIISWQTTGMYEGGEENHLLISIGEDITEKNQAEEMLKISEEKLRTTIENINDIIIWKMDEKGIFTYVSPAVVNILGYVPDEMEKTLGLLYFKPEDKLLIQKKMADRIKGDRTSNKFDMVAKDGSFIPMELSSSVIKNENGNIIGFSGIARDITQQKRAEEEIFKLKNNLEVKVAEKTKELNEKIVDLQRFFDATVDRELRMKEISDENDKLKAELKIFKKTNQV